MIPDESKFCLSCGKPLEQAQTQAPQQPSPPEEDDSTEMFSMMAMAFAFMLFFFSLVPFFLGATYAGMAMLGVGVVLILVSYRMVRVSKRERVQMVEKKATKVKIKCRYCGTLNDEAEQRCGSCGASL